VTCKTDRKTTPTPTVDVVSSFAPTQLM